MTGSSGTAQTTSTHRRILDRFYAAVAAKGAEEIAAAINGGFASDAVMVVSASLPYGGVHEGRDAIHRLLATLARTRTPMVLVEHMRIRRMIEAGDEIAVDVEFPWMALGATEPISMSAVEWFTFRNNKVVEMNVGYRDTAACVAAMAAARKD